MIENREKSTVTMKIQILLLCVALLPYVIVPLLGCQFYFRHDDSAHLLWAKEFTKPLHRAFSTDPTVNNFAYYPGKVGYWRPFGSLYIKVLWHLFGASPGPYYLVGGLAFMGAVYFLFRLAKERSGIPAAVLSCLALFAAFHGTMYNLFHIAVAKTFFFQMGTIYCFWAYLKRYRWYHLLGMFLLFGPAMGRQTTLIILIVIFVLVLFEEQKWRSILSYKHLPVFMIILAGFYMMSISPLAGQGSVLAVFPDYHKVVQFLQERFFYYGSILTRGVAGVFMLLLFSGGVLQRVSKTVERRWSFERVDWVWPPVALAMTFLFVRFYPIGVYWLVFCFLYLFVVDGELRLPLGWAGASLLSFLAVQYYHNGYLLGAAFPLSIVLGILIVRLLTPAVLALKGWAGVHFSKMVGVAVGVGIVIVVLPVFFGVRVPVLSARMDVMRIAVESNKNFKRLMVYMAHALPRNAVVYELSEEETGTTMYDRRFLPLKERAVRVKVMNIEDTLVMLKVLDRGDIQIYPASRLGEMDPSRENFLVALNRYERRIVESRFRLEVVQEFGGDRDSAAIYRVLWDADVSS